MLSSCFTSGLLQSGGHAAVPGLAPAGYQLSGDRQQGRTGEVRHRTQVIMYSICTPRLKK